MYVYMYMCVYMYIICIPGFPAWSSVNTSKNKFHVTYIYKSTYHLTANIQSLYYKEEPLDVAPWNNRCLFREY
jgi:hypothetical protein